MTEFLIDAALMALAALFVFIAMALRVAHWREKCQIAENELSWERVSGPSRLALATGYFTRSTVRQDLSSRH